jgi:hypothetical protein
LQRSSPGRVASTRRGAAARVEKEKKKFVKIADLRPYMKNISVHFIVLEKGPVTKTKDDHYVHQYLVADQTGSIWLSLWDEQGLQLMPGDIVQLRSGYCTLFKNALVLYTGRHGTLERVGEFVMLFSETPNMSMYDWVPDANNPQILVPVPPGSQDRPPNQRNQFFPQPLPPLQTAAAVGPKSHHHVHAPLPSSPSPSPSQSQSPLPSQSSSQLPPHP